MIRRLKAPALALLLVLACPVPQAAQAAQKAAPRKTAATPAPAQQQETAEVRGRIVAGMDRVFIKAEDGYCLVEGQKLAPFAGRMVRAKVLVIGRGEEYRTVRLLEHEILSPDDESPAAARDDSPQGKGRPRQAGARPK